MQTAPMNFYIYDLETMFNCFLFAGKFVGAAEVQQFEMSPRANHRTELLQWLDYLRNCNAYMVGYNNLGFDYPLIHELIMNPYTFDFNRAYHKAQEIIGGQRFGGGGNFNSIRMGERYLPQIDLLKVHHFDNAAKSTSLKALQFAMRSESVEDMPFAFNHPLTSEQMDVMRSYNRHDIEETEKFFLKSKPAIDMRFQLLQNGVLGGDVLNYSDVKIGTEYLVKKIGRQKCYLSGSKPRQTIRHEIQFKDVILPKIDFKTEQFEAILDWFKAQTIYVSASERPKLQAKLRGLDFHFGVGGVHASVENRIFETNETHVIKDIDVSGMYVSVAIANGFAPEHLGADFVTAYRQLQSDRAQYPKGSFMNLVLKLAGNGAFGNSNNDYSPLYDPKYTYSITINGQLQVLQLVEMLALLPIELIQANTDGVTAYMPREVEPFFNMWCSEWEKMTGLKLEHVPYKKMWIRDVNNYLALTMDGKIKRKGAYWYPITEEDYHGSSGSNWNKDFSNMTAQKMAESAMIHGVPIESAIRLISDPFDFMMRYKVRGSDKLYIGDQEMTKTVRYYVSTKGEPMKKIAPPKGELGQFKRKNSLKDKFFDDVMKEIGPGKWDARIHTANKSVYAMAETSVESGWLVKCCNKASDFDWRDVDYDYYIDQVRKLVIDDAGRA